MCKHFDLKILQASGLQGVSVEPVRHIDVLSGCDCVRPPQRCLQCQLCPVGVVGPGLVDQVLT